MKSICSLVIVTLIAGALPAQYGINPAPELTQDNLDRWMTFIRPNEEELLWQKIRWHKDYEAAVKEARQLKRPILLWTMNGHPCGET